MKTYFKSPRGLEEVGEPGWTDWAIPYEALEGSPYTERAAVDVNGSVIRVTPDQEALWDSAPFTIYPGDGWEILSRRRAPYEPRYRRTWGGGFVEFPDNSCVPASEALGMP